MKKTKLLQVLALFAISIVGILGGCSDTRQGKDESRGSVAMALTNAAGDCVSGTVVITGGPTAATYNLPVACNQELDSVALLPGQYNINVPNPICDPADATVPPGAVYNHCEFIPAGPFTVVLGQEVDVSLSFMFFWDGAAPAPIVFGVGTADIGFGGAENSPVNPVLCGGVPSGTPCGMNSNCYTYNNTAPACYVRCETGDPACTGGTVCALLADPAQLGTNVTMPLPRICVNPAVVVGAGGAGGDGAGGAPAAGAGGDGGAAPAP